jgi:structural maintenance of chromosome 2
VLQDDIMPALDKLRKEKLQYNEWQSARDSVDKLCRFCVAFNYVEAEK